VKVADTLDSRLAEEALRRRTSKSAVVREGVEKVLLAPHKDRARGAAQHGQGRCENVLLAVPVSEEMAINEASVIIHQGPDHESYGYERQPTYSESAVEEHNHSVHSAARFQV
jgi:hypothetical protein